MRRLMLLIVMTFVSSLAVDLHPYLTTGVATAQEVAAPAVDQSLKRVAAPATVFILDCSYSMSASFGRRLGQQATIPRLKAAIAALTSTLDELSQPDATLRPSVGVWFVGHRVGWIQNPVRITRNSAAADGPIPADLAPAEDVECVLPLGIFSAAEFGTVSKRLARVTYHGQTPVNLAIFQALTEFDALGGNEPKRVVVITDGPNDQWHPKDPQFGTVRTVSTQDVIDAWQRSGKPITISILYLGEPAAVQEYEVLSKATGGQVRQPKTAAALAKDMRELIRTD